MIILPKHNRVQGPGTFNTSLTACSYATYTAYLYIAI